MVHVHGTRTFRICFLLNSGVISDGSPRAARARCSYQSSKLLPDSIALFVRVRTHPTPTATSPVLTFNGLGWGSYGRARSVRDFISTGSVGGEPH